MPNFNNLGNSQESFANYAEKLKNFLTDAREYNIRERENKSLRFLKRLGGDRKGVRLAIKDKKPQYSTGSG